MLTWILLISASEEVPSALLSFAFLVQLSKSCKKWDAAQTFNHYLLVQEGESRTWDVLFTPAGPDYKSEIKPPFFEWILWLVRRTSFFNFWQVIAFYRQAWQKKRWVFFSTHYVLMWKLLTMRSAFIWHLIWIILGHLCVLYTRLPSHYRYMYM